MKRTPLTRRTPLRAKSGLKRKTRLRSMSPKRRRDQRTRSEMVREELAKRELCEAGARIYQYRLATYGQTNADRLNATAHSCAGLAIELHEPLTRARGGSILDPANTVAICRSCHNWIHDHPKGATELGLLQSTNSGTARG